VLLLPLLSGLLLGLAWLAMPVTAGLLLELVPATQDLAAAVRCD